MSRLNECHKPKAGIEGKCSVPMFNGYGPAGFCDRPAFGEQYEGPFIPGRFQAPNHRPYCSGLCCEVHGGPSETGTRFMRDGNMWHAFRPGFENLQESISGFGSTQGAAYDDMARLIAEDINKARGQ